MISLKLWCLFGLVIIGLVAATDQNNTTNPFISTFNYSIQSINLKPYNGSYKVDVYNDTNGQATSYNRTFENGTEALNWFQNMFSKLDFEWWWPFA